MGVRVWASLGRSPGEGEKKERKHTQKHHKNEHKYKGRVNQQGQSRRRKRRKKGPEGYPPETFFVPFRFFFPFRFFCPFFFCPVAFFFLSRYRNTRSSVISALRPSSVSCCFPFFLKIQFCFLVLLQFPPDQCTRNASEVRFAIVLS